MIQSNNDNLLYNQSLLDESENFIQNKFGFCFYSLDSIPLIYNLYIHSRYRRCGHSRTLLELVINEIRKSGYSKEIFIQVEPRENSIELADLTKYYENMGLVIYDQNKIIEENNNDKSI